MTTTRVHDGKLQVYHQASQAWIDTFSLLQITGGLESKLSSLDRGTLNSIISTLSALLTRLATVESSTNLTNQNINHLKDLMGSSSEEPPTTDTDPSALNGRLQRIAHLLSDHLTYLQIISTSSDPNEIGSQTGLQVRTNLERDGGILNLMQGNIDLMVSLLTALNQKTKSELTIKNPKIIVPAVTTETQLVAADSNRRMLSIYNSATTSTLTFSLGPQPIRDTFGNLSFTGKIKAGGMLILEDYKATPSVQGVWDVLEGKAHITEGVG